MDEKVKSLFVRVVARKMQEENKTADEVMNIYPKLTFDERKEIKSSIQ